MPNDGLDDSGDSSIPSDGPKNVLWLILDGVRIDEITTTLPSDITGVSGEEYSASTWASLGKNGTVIRSILHPGITNTGSSHVAMLTGRTQAYGTVATTDENISMYRPELPTLFQLARTQLGLDVKEARFLANTELLHDASGTLYPGLAESDVAFEAMVDEQDKPIEDDSMVFSRLKEIISTDHPRLFMVNIHDVDRQGHEGHNGRYSENVAGNDAELGALWDWLHTEEKDWMANTLVLLTTDHGRHSVDLGYDPIWQEHGDSCRGCRELPLFIAGPGVPEGEVLEADWAQPDLTALVASYLGVEMPFARGLPLGLISGLEETVPSGVQQLSASNGSVASVVLLNDLEHRSAVEVDGERLSNPEAWAAEAPTLLKSQTAMAVCWRELIVDMEEDTWPWVPRCLRKKQGGSWVDIGFPMDEVGVLTEFSLMEVEDRLVVGWVDNENSSTTAGRIGNAIGVNVVFWTENRLWEEPYEVEGIFPTNQSMATLDGTPWVAAAYTGIEAQARYTRQIGVGDASMQRWRAFELMEVLGTWARAERPALRVDGGRIQVAAFGYDSDSSEIIYWESLDKGQSWSEPVALAQLYPFLPQLSPRWVEDKLVWAVLMEDQAGVCLAIPGETPVCRGLGSLWIESFSIDQGNMLASSYQGEGVWAIQTVALP